MSGYRESRVAAADAPSPRAVTDAASAGRTHVAMVTSSVSRAAGGIYPIVRDLGLALEESGLRVSVAGVADRYTADDAAGWGTLRPHACRSVGPQRLRFAPTLGRHLAGLSADLVHTHGIWQYPSHAVRDWGRRTGRPWVVSPQGMLDPWALRRSGWKKRIALAAFERAHLEGAACLHATCSSEVDAIRSALPKAAICLLPNGVQPPGPRPDAPPPWQLSAARGHKVLLFLGRVHPKKGVGPLIEAWASSRRAVSAAKEWHLAVVGWDDGGHRPALERRADALGVGGSVTFCGPAYGAAKAAALAAADAFVLPSVSEGLPVAVLEAWAHGQPAVLTPGCNLPAGFDRGAAVRIQPDAESIAAGLGRLFAMTDAERRQMGENGRRLVEDCFAWPAIAAGFREVYEWCLGGPRPGCLV